MRVLFGTDGIRGKAHEYPLDQATMYKLGVALTRRFDGSPLILLGRDTRESGPEIAGALAAGIRDAGGRPGLIGGVPTPAVASLCRSTEAAAGISISASHNPFDDNGVKIFGHDGMKLPDAVEEEIEDELGALRRDDVRIAIVELSPSYELTRKYEDFLVSGVAPNALAGVQVVLDTGNGAAYEIAPEVFRRAGAKVHVLNDKPNGLNINEDAGALHPERLAKIVRNEKAEFGVAFDGDADRAIFVDDWGNVRDGDEIIYLWAQKLRGEGKLD